MSRNPEVIVVGGGPAGACASRLLALWGRRVLLLTRPPSGRGDLAESLPPTIRKLFDTFRITRAVDDAGFPPAGGNTVWWTGLRGRITRFEEGPGWQVGRRRFDALLLDLAEAAGAEVRRDATVEHVELDGDRPVVRVRGEGGGAEAPRSAPYVLDCSGRAGVVASRGLRARVASTRTNALIGSWRRPGGWDLSDESHTLVEGYRDGWAWSIPVEGHVRYFTAMVDPSTTDLRSEDGLDAMYRAELEKTARLAPLLHGAEPVGAPWACGATPYSARRFAGPGFLLVGDAASFIDPLSSYGVKKALASAWLACVVVNTLLDEPELEAEALDFHEARERKACRSYLARSAGFYREGASVHDHPFWRRRAAMSTGSGDASEDEASGRHGGEPGEPDPESLREDPRVQAAFARLREAPRIRLRPTGPTTLVRAPAVQDRRLVLQDRLATPSHPDGLRHLRGVDVVTLTRLATTIDDSRSDVPGLYRRYETVAGSVALPDFLGALSVLLAEGILENVASGPGSAEGRPLSRTSHS